MIRLAVLRCCGMSVATLDAFFRERLDRSEGDSRNNASRFREPDWKELIAHEDREFYSAGDLKIEPHTVKVTMGLTFHINESPLLVVITPVLLWSQDRQAEGDRTIRMPAGNP